MKTKKIIALAVLTLFALLIVPIAYNTASQNTWTPILPTSQVNTAPKAITTEPLGNYIQDGDNLTYDGLYTLATLLSGGEPEGIPMA